MFICMHMSIKASHLLSNRFSLCPLYAPSRSSCQQQASLLAPPWPAKRTANPHPTKTLPRIVPKQVPKHMPRLSRLQLAALQASGAAGATLPPPAALLPQGGVQRCARREAREAPVEQARVLGKYINIAICIYILNNCI